MSNEIGIGLIGCGGRLRGVARRTISNSDRLKIRSAYDTDPRSIDSTKELFGDDIAVKESLDELVNDPSIEWVMIGSWNNAHCEQTVAAFEAGKHVFCEKPLATSFDDCVAMHDAWKKSGKLFAIGFTLRYSPHYRKLKELLASGAIGDLISMEFNETLNFNHGGYIHGDWRRLTKFAGTHLLEKCCHDVDLVNWLVDSQAMRVAGFGGCNFFIPENEKHIARIGKNDRGQEAYRTWPGLINKNPFTSDKDILDNQVAIIEFANKVRTTFHTNCNCGIPERRMYFCGTEGAIRADVIPGIIQLQRIGFGEQIQEVGTDAKGGHGGGDGILGQEIAECMLNGVLPSAGLEDGLRSALTCFAIDQATETGQVVDLADWWQRAGLAKH